MSILTMTEEQYAAHQRRVQGARKVTPLGEQIRPTEVRSAAAKRGHARSANNESRLASQMTAAGLKFERQYRWHPERKFRADFAFVDRKLLVELDGAAHRIKGRFKDDILKSQECLYQGWTLLRIASSQVRDGSAVDVIKRVLGEAPRETYAAVRLPAEGF